MNRRIFLRGLGGAVVAAPFLSSLGERRARAQSGPPVPARRLIAMFTHYGCITNKFFPSKSHGALTAADLQGTTLEHLAPYVNKLLIPRGIRGMNEWTIDLSRGQGNDPHIQVVESYFTCQPVTPNSDEPFRFDNSTLFSPMPMGRSLDHVIAEQISPMGTPLFMRVGNQSENASTRISFTPSTSTTGSATAYPGLGAPNQILTMLTGLFQSGAPISPDSYRAARGKSIIDLVKDDLDTLERFDLSRSDTRKLEAWKDLLHQTTNVLTAAQCNAEAAAAVGITQANVDAMKSSLGSDMLTLKINGTELDGADMYSNFAVLAAICNANPVIFLKYPGNYVFKGLGIMTESHSLSHRLDNAGMQGPCLPNAVAMLLSIDDFYARKFAYLVGKLDSVSEADGNLLDHTAAVWFQEMSDGNAHNLNNLPIIQAGSAGGYFKTGWTVNVDDGAANLTAGNSEAECTDGTSDQKINGTTGSTGTNPKYANAPINKYFCNLMNALGVKAGDDGFPLKGGSAEVTHYGMYDKTEDFIHGGTNPPTIHNPGEFKALRAGS